MMRGMKSMVAQNMMPSVRWLETLSHTVRLAAGMELDGMTKGNIDAPAVPITPSTANEEATKALSVQRRRSNKALSSAPPMPSAGSSHSSGC